MAKKDPKPEPTAPPALVAALKKNKKAKTYFEQAPPSHRREYIEWIIEAKTGQTRDRRIASALEWMAGEKSRNWQYKKK